jgi:hypothetical protein
VRIVRSGRSFALHKAQTAHDTARLLRAGRVLGGRLALGLLRQLLLLLLLADHVQHAPHDVANSQLCAYVCACACVRSCVQVWVGGWAVVCVDAAVLQ